MTLDNSASESTRFKEGDTQRDIPLCWSHVPIELHLYPLHASIELSSFSIPTLLLQRTSGILIFPSSLCENRIPQSRERRLESLISGRQSLLSRLQGRKINISISPSDNCSEYVPITEGPLLVWRLHTIRSPHLAIHPRHHCHRALWL